jgi:capsular polysaccharide transport system permease protein
MGVLNCYLVAVFPIWGSVWNILTTPLFLISGIFYIYEDLPRIGQEILWYNPLIHIIGIMRRGFYPTYDAVYVSIPFVLSVSLITMALGFMLLRRYHKDILNR